MWAHPQGRAKSKSIIRNAETGCLIEGSCQGFSACVSRTNSSSMPVLSIAANCLTCVQQNSLSSKTNEALVRGGT